MVKTDPLSILNFNSLNILVGLIQWCTSTCLQSFKDNYLGTFPVLGQYCSYLLFKQALEHFSEQPLQNIANERMKTAVVTNYLL